MVEFIRKFENCGIKIAGVNSILTTKSINLLYFCTVLGSVVIESDFQCNSPFIEKSIKSLNDFRPGSVHFNYFIDQ